MYEFDARSRRGMKGMGWADSFTVGGQSLGPLEIYCSSGSVSGGTKICAPASERTFMAQQGCTALTGSAPCSSSSIGGDHTGTQYCCPVGRPGTAATVEGGRESYSSADIRSLQTAINAVGGGCSAGTVDGNFGPNTRAGLECWAGRVGYPTIIARFPFVSTLVSSVSSTKSDTTTGGSVVRQPTPTSTSEQQQEPSTIETAIYNKWYFWAGLAAVATIGVAGIAYYQHKKSLEEEDMSSELALAR
jgi:hypothetical protein